MELLWQSVSSAVLEAEINKGAWQYESPGADPEGHRALRVRRQEDCLDILIGQGALFRKQAESVDCLIADWLDPRLAEHYLFGPTMALWLELDGDLVLHAAGVNLGKGTIGLVADNGVGKSTLSSFLWSRGAAVVTDDLFAITRTTEREGELGVRSSFPEARLAPDLAARLFAEKSRDLKRLHSSTEKVRVPIQQVAPDSWLDGIQPLRGLAFLTREPPSWRMEGSELPVSSERMGGQETFRQLLVCSFSPLAPEALGLSAGRLESLARVVASAPAWHLRFADGLANLPAVESLLRTL